MKKVIIKKKVRSKKGVKTIEKPVKSYIDKTPWDRGGINE